MFRFFFCAFFILYHIFYHSLAQAQAPFEDKDNLIDDVRTYLAPISVADSAALNKLRLFYELTPPNAAEKTRTLFQSMHERKYIAKNFHQTIDLLYTLSTLSTTSASSSIVNTLSCLDSVVVFYEQVDAMRTLGRVKAMFVDTLSADPYSTVSLDLPFSSLAFRRPKPSAKIKDKVRTRVSISESPLKDETKIFDSEEKNN